VTGIYGVTEEEEEEQKNAMDTRRNARIQNHDRHQVGSGRTQENGIDLVPKEYQSFAKVFDEPSSRRFPKVCPWDHAIDLKLDAKPYAGKAYSLDNNQKEALRTFISENLDKGYIRPSLLPGWLLSSLLERRTANYTPAKTIDTSMNKQSRTNTRYP